MSFKTHLLYNYKPVFDSYDSKEVESEFEFYKECMVKNETIQILDVNLKVVKSFDTWGKND